MSDPGIGEVGCGNGELGNAAVIEETRLVELVEADEVVESSVINSTFHVCSVASGANDTRRFAFGGSVEYFVRSFDDLTH